MFISDFVSSKRFIENRSIQQIQKNSSCSFLITSGRNVFLHDERQIHADAPCETSAMFTSSIVENIFDASPVDARRPSPTTQMTA